MNKYIINIIGDNQERTIVTMTSTSPEHHIEYFKNLFEQWYKTYQILSIDIEENITLKVEI